MARAAAPRKAEGGTVLAAEDGVRDRRSYPQRVALVRRIVEEVFSHRSFTLQAVDCARLFGVAAPICERILFELEGAGILQQARPGIWMRRVHA